MVAPYDSIYHTMMHFDAVDWYSIELQKSTLRPNTFIINVDNHIDLHYVHYKLDPSAKSIVQEQKFDAEEHWTGDVFYCEIWEFIYQKYKERTERMLKTNEDPKFLIRDEDFANTNTKRTIKDIAYCESPYKRIIITRDKSILRNDDICKTIHVNHIEMPEPTVRHNLSSIRGFFNI